MMLGEWFFFEHELPRIEHEFFINNNYMRNYMGNYMKIICLKEKYLAGNVYLCRVKQ